MKLGISIGYSGPQMNLPVEKGPAGRTSRLRLRLDRRGLRLRRRHPRLAYLAAVTWTASALGPASCSSAARHGRQLRHVRRHRRRHGRGQPFHRPGIGVSGPQIVEGWYGEPWGKPYYRIRDYVQIMRKIFERERPVMHEGREISLPTAAKAPPAWASPSAPSST